MYSAVILTAVRAFCSKNPIEERRADRAEQNTAASAGTVSSPAAPSPQPPQAAGDTALRKAPPRYAGIMEVKNNQHFIEIIEGAGDSLVVFELYADWCMPCRVLTPVLAELAQKHFRRAWFFKINTDVLPQVAQTFGARGIPYVAFVKNTKAVHALMGVQPGDSYEQAILKFSDTLPKTQSATKRQ